MQKRKKKLDDELFLLALKKNKGLFVETARFIEKKWGIQYRRQTVRQRALTHFKEELAEIKELNKDIAEKTILDLMDKKVPEKIRLDAAKHYLRTQAKERGYDEKISIDMTHTIEVHVEDEEAPDWISQKVGE